MKEQIENMVDDLTTELWAYYKTVDQSDRVLPPAEFQAVIYATDICRAPAVIPKQS